MRCTREKSKTISASMCLWNVNTAQKKKRKTKKWRKTSNCNELKFKRTKHTLLFSLAAILFRIFLFFGCGVYCIARIWQVNFGRPPANQRCARLPCSFWHKSRNATLLATDHTKFMSVNYIGSLDASECVHLMCRKKSASCAHILRSQLKFSVQCRAKGAFKQQERHAIIT